jgi:hypothetical protein
LLAAASVRDPPFWADVGSVPIKTLAVQILKFCAPADATSGALWLRTNRRSGATAGLGPAGHRVAQPAWAAVEIDGAHHSWLAL